VVTGPLILFDQKSLTLIEMTLSSPQNPITRFASPTSHHLYAYVEHPINISVLQWQTTAEKMSESSKEITGIGLENSRGLELRGTPFIRLFCSCSDVGGYRAVASGGTSGARPPI